MFAAIHVAVSAGPPTVPLQPFRTFPENPEPHSSFPFKAAARDKILHWPRLEECQRQHLTSASAVMVSVSVWTGSLAVLDKNLVTSSADSIRRFELEGKQSRPCSECSQCLSVRFLFFTSLLFLDCSSSGKARSRKSTEIKGWMYVREDERRRMGTTSDTHVWTNASTFLWVVNSAG